MRHVFAGLLGFLLAGCGAGPKPIAKAPPPQPAAEEPEVERRPYAETADMPSDALTSLDGVYLRLANPEATWAKLPSMIGALPVTGPIKEITQGRVPGMSAALSAVVDPTQPVEIVFGEDRTFAYRVRSPDAVLHGHVGLVLQRVSTGVWDIEGLAAPTPEPEEATEFDPDGAGGAPPDEDMQVDPSQALSEPMHCRLMHLPPPVDYRVICADSAAGLRQATPFLVSARRVTQGGGGELHVELGGEPYRQFVEHARRSFENSPSRHKKTAQDERFDKMFSEVAMNLFDSERLAFDAQLTGNDVELALDFAYRADSPLAPWLDWAKQQRAPESVRQLPEDSAIRLGVAGLGKAGVSALVDDFMTSMDETLVLSTAEKQELRSAMTGVLPSDGRFVLALGVDADTAKAALDSDEVRLADEAGRPLGKRALARVQAAAGQWFAIGVDVAGDRYLQDFKRVVALQNHKTRVRSPDAEQAQRTHSSMKLSGTPAGLPARSLHYVEQITPNPKFQATSDEPAALPSERQWLLLPDGPRAWIVAAPSLTKAKQLAARVLRSPGAPDPLLAESNAAFNMALSMWGVEFIDMKVDTKAQRDAARSSFKRATTAPSHGHLQLPFSLRALPRTDGAGTRLVLQSRLNLSDVFGNAMSLIPTPDLPAP